MTKEQVAEIRNYKIYKHELPNGKIYIGVTSAEKLYDRFQYGNGYVKQSFGEEVLKYGWSQVKTEILEEVLGDYLEASTVEAYWIQKYVRDGYDVCNKHHAAPPKEYKYNLNGCTVVDTNTYYDSFQAAAAFIGVTRQAVRAALQEGRPCKGWHLEYGDVTIKEEDK